MAVRVVRFTDVTSERIDGLKGRIAERSGPPDGVDATGVQFLHDAEQNTMIVIQHFESREKLDASEAALEAMDPDQTPGTRSSIDRCEVIAELDA